RVARARCADRRVRSGAPRAAPRARLPSCRRARRRARARELNVGPRAAGTARRGGRRRAAAFAPGAARVGRGGHRARDLRAAPAAARAGLRRDARRGGGGRARCLRVPVLRRAGGRAAGPRDRADLRDRRVGDGRLVRAGFRPMLARAQEAAAELDGLARSGAAAGSEASAAADFLHWLVDGGFVFLGYREYQVLTLGGSRVLLVRSGSGLGLLRRESRSAFSRPRPVAELPEPVRARLLGDRLLTITKTIATSPVHCRTRMDDIGIRQLDATGHVIGERRFLGLFTSKAYAEEAAEIPLLRRVLRQILAAEQVVPGSHDYKEMVAIFNVLPKDDLFSATPAEIRADIEAVMAAGRTGDVVVSLRPRPTGFSALVVLPRDRLSGEARQRILETLARRAGGPCLGDHLVLLEDRALLSFTFAGDGPAPTGAELADVQEAVRDLVRGWRERLEDELRARHGPAEAARLAARYRAAFPDEYRASTPPAPAAVDAALLEAALGQRA